MKRKKTRTDPVGSHKLSFTQVAGGEPGKKKARLQLAQ